MSLLRRTTSTLALFAAGLLLLGACATGSPTPSPAQSSTPRADVESRLVGANDFARAVAQPGRVTINVHVPFEGAISGTDLMIPYDEIKQQASRLPEDRSTPLAIYCRTGSMSETAAKTLTTLGYTDVVDLQGGMQAWEASGRSLTGR